MENVEPGFKEKTDLLKRPPPRESSGKKVDNSARSNSTLTKSKQVNKHTHARWRKEMKVLCVVWFPRPKKATSSAIFYWGGTPTVRSRGWWCDTLQSSLLSEALRSSQASNQRIGRRRTDRSSSLAIRTGSQMRHAFRYGTSRRAGRRRGRRAMHRIPGPGSGRPKKFRAVLVQSFQRGWIGLWGRPEPAWLGKLIQSWQGDGHTCGASDWSSAGRRRGVVVGELACPRGPPVLNAMDRQSRDQIRPLPPARLRTTQDGRGGLRH